MKIRETTGTYCTREKKGAKDGGIEEGLKGSKPVVEARDTPGTCSVVLTDSVIGLNQHFIHSLWSRVSNTNSCTDINLYTPL